MTWTAQTKSSISVTGPNRSSATWVSANRTLVNLYLLLENASFILLETGDKIILDQSVATPAAWSGPTKS